jgi:hypothetical protein
MLFLIGWKGWLLHHFESTHGDAFTDFLWLLLYVAVFQVRPVIRRVA